MLVATLLIALAVRPGAAGVRDLETTLREKFQPSGIEMQDPARRGAVVRTGKLLTVLVDGIPAKPFRVVQADRTSPAVHVMDFATVEITADARIQAETAPIVLAKGTRVVVLDVRVEGDRVRLLAHTADPVPVAWGTGVYGCTEFVFRLDRRALEAGTIDRVLAVVGQWLAPTSEERFCAPGVEPLCVEP